MERMIRGGVARLSGSIEQALRERDTGLQVPHIKGLSDLAASILHCRSVNTSEIAAVFPRSVKNDDSRYRVINRWLQNKMIDPVTVMSAFAAELIEKACCYGKTAVLMMDQSKVGNKFECLMVSLRMGERALPLLWRVVETEGNIGFGAQKLLLDGLKALVPQGCNVMLTADRFYGTAALIDWCQQAGWAYRIRLKGNLTLSHRGANFTTGDVARFGGQGIQNAELCRSGVITSVGVLHEKGHTEPWIIAMDAKPTTARVRDYGMRWGIEALFSDFKSRGFSITDTHLGHADRIERLILALTVALYFAVSTAMQPDTKEPKYTPKKPIAD
jgi:hypothetical protein